MSLIFSPESMHHFSSEIYTEHKFSNNFRKLSHLVPFWLTNHLSHLLILLGNEKSMMQVQELMASSKSKQVGLVKYFFYFIPYQNDTRYETTLKQGANMS